MRTVNAILLMFITVVGVFFTNPLTEMSEMSCGEYPYSDETKEKNLRAKQKEGGKLTKTNINMARFGSRLSRFFLCCVYIFLLFFFLVFNHNFLLSLFQFILSPDPFQPRKVFALAVFLVMLI